VPANNHSYSYSQLNQLQNVSSLVTAFGYDHAHNLVKLANGAAQGFGAANQLCWSTPATPSRSPTCSAPPAGATTYGYDSRGNRISATQERGLPWATPTTRGLSSIAGQGTYTSNGDGLRMSKTVGSGSSTVNHAFAWDQAGSLPLLLTDTTQVTGTAVPATTAYIYGPGGLPLEQVTPPPPISLVMATSATSAVL
jgi:hypothetical protein